MPTPLPSDPAELEAAVRALVAAELLAAAGNWPAAQRPRYVDTEAEWLRIATIKHPQSNFETRVVFLNFDGFSERDEGPCNHTILTLTYGVDVFFGLVDKRRDGSNSHDDFTAFVMRTRARFKANRSFGYERDQLEHQLLQTDVAARVEKTDFVTGHRINLLLDVEVG